MHLLLHRSDRPTRRCTRRPLARTWTWLVAGLALLSLDLPANAHGTVAAPPPWGGPGDTVPGSGGGSRRSRPAGPFSGGAPTGGAAVPPAPATPGGTGATASPTSPGRPLDLRDGSAWTWWWELHREAFLELRGRLAESDPISRGDGFYLGHGAREATVAGAAPDDATIRSVVIPALLAALAAPESNDMQSASLLALARIGEDLPPDERGSLAAVIEPFLANPVQEVAESAALALGVLAWPRSAPLLAALVSDEGAGRRAVGDSSVPQRTRAFAAYGLGLLAHGSANEDVRRFVVQRLSNALQEKEQATPDLAVACILALGRTHLPWSGALPDEDGARFVGASRESEALFVARIAGEGRRHRFVRAHALVSLASLLEDADEADLSGLASAAALRARVLDAIAEPLESPRKHDDEVVQCAAIAAGMLADDDEDAHDVRLRTALLKCAAKNADRAAERFATIALGRAGGRRGAGETGAGTGAVRVQLLKQLARGRGGLDRWAGLGLALLERGRIEAGILPERAVADALRTKLAESKSPSDIGALAIAAGILRDPAAVEPLGEHLATTSDDAARGFCSVGLGLLGAREQLQNLQVLLANAQWRPVLLREVAIALGLLGDRDAVELLLDRFRATESLVIRASIAQALGRIGDARAVAPLVGLLGDEQANATARALAAAALGLVCDRDALPFGTLYSLNANPLAAPATLFDGQGRGVLDIL